MNALFLDTSTEVLSLCARSKEAWASLVLCRGLQHSPALLPLAERLLADVDLRVEDLEVVVCSVGPGSFTGIRIGISTALGIGHGRGIPVVGVSTLDALGLAWASHTGDVFPVIDARRGNIYTARYRGGERQGDYRDVSPAELVGLLAQASSPLLAGPDASRIRAILGGDAGGGAHGAGTDGGGAAGGGAAGSGAAGSQAAAVLPVSDSVDPRVALDLGVRTLQARGAEAAFPRPLYLRKSEAERVSGR